MGMEGLLMLNTPQESSSEQEQIELRNADDMSDENFLKHMDHRHEQGIKLFGFPHIKPQQIEMWRNYHDRLHEIAFQGQYDHTHRE